MKKRNKKRLCELCGKKPVFTFLIGIGWLCQECMKKEVAKWRKEKSMKGYSIKTEQ